MAPKGMKLSAESRAKIPGRPISSKAPAAIHLWLRKHHPKTGRCDECGRKSKTDLAFLHHPRPHTRNREDYLELCRKCHRKMDDPIYGWSTQILSIPTIESRRAGQRASTIVRFGNRKETA